MRRYKSNIYYYNTCRSQSKRSKLRPRKSCFTFGDNIAHATCPFTRFYCEFSMHCKFNMNFTLFQNLTAWWKYSNYVWCSPRIFCWHVGQLVWWAVVIKLELFANFEKTKSTAETGEQTGHSFAQFWNCRWNCQWYGQFGNQRCNRLEISVRQLFVYFFKKSAVDFLTFQTLTA